MSDKFAVLRKSVDSDWTVVAVWDTWQEADRDCEQRRKEEQNQAMLTWERISDPVEYWHTHETGMSLREFLGMTKEQYDAFLIQGDNAATVTIVRGEAGQSVVTVTKDAVTGHIEKGGDSGAEHS